jgi:methionyl aminopeptidase
MVLLLKTPEEIGVMREAGRIVAKAHIAMKDALRPGISTGELDKIPETVILEHGAVPAFLIYPKKDAPNYPGTINASINNELVHGLPSDKRIVKEGDIISLDTGCIYQGFVGDCAYTYAVGEVPASVLRLMQVTEEALQKAIDASVLPNTIRDVALTTQRFVESHGYSVAREYTGHGVGRSMHEEPEVPNWWSRIAERRGRKNQPLQVGMTYAIEPMVIAGRSDLMELDDQWTVVTKDGSLCAHFEHTIAVTDGKPIILTLP